MKNAVLPWLALIILSGCAATRGTGHPADALPRWPFAGLTEIKGLSLSIYADRFLSGTCLEFDPSGRLFAGSGIPGSLTIVQIPDGTITSVYDFGRGSVIENLVFDSHGRQMYALASTVQPENIGEVQLARAALQVDTELPLLLAPVPLTPDGYSHGMVLLERDGFLFTLDTAGSDNGGGATLSRADLFVDELAMRRPIGNLPAGVRRRGIATDSRQLRLFALLTDGEPGSDFDPPPPAGRKASPPAAATVFLAAIAKDSLTIQERVPLVASAHWFGVVPTPRGVLVAGVTSRGTSLVEIDTQLMRQVAWLELPEATTDIAVNGTTAILPSRFGLYVVDLGFLSLKRFIPVDLERPSEAALSPDGATACAILEDVRWPGRPALGIIDMNTGEVERIIQ